MHTGQRNFTALPVIDISGLYRDEPAQRQAVADQLGVAAREVGFFYITGHGIEPQLIAGLREASRALFAQTISE